MVRPNDQLSIGEVSARSGHAQSALRHYETLGLIASVRTAGNQRRFRRSVLRRLAVIKAAQRVGLTLTDVARSFAGIDPHGAPNRGQWRRISAEWQPLVNQRIAENGAGPRQSCQLRGLRLSVDEAVQPVQPPGQPRQHRDRSPSTVPGRLSVNAHHRSPRRGRPVDWSRPRPNRRPSRYVRWAGGAGIAVSDRGRLHPEVWQAWREARSQ